jgi:hypothetical protein
VLRLDFCWSKPANQQSLLSNRCLTANSQSVAPGGSQTHSVACGEVRMSAMGH